MNFNDKTPEIGDIFAPYLEKRLGARRKPGEPITQKHKDIAASLQKRLEDVVVDFARSNSRQGYDNLCISGGVAHNCPANGKLLNSRIFKNIYVPPAPGDAGLSVGSAFCLHNRISKKPSTFCMRSAYWGPGYSGKDIALTIKKLNRENPANSIKASIIDNRNDLCSEVATEISKGKVIGWFQGRSELGPRALGNRSILADPRRSDMKDILNSRIKNREMFRPFAPSILSDYVGEYFYDTNPSPFMSFTYKIKEGKRNIIPAICHIDGTARLQTVSKEANSLYWQLLDEFRKLTGVPILLNTSFNENEPIVSSPKEAIECFLRTKMDILIINRYLIKR